MADKIINSFDVWIKAQGLKSQLRLRNIENISLEGIVRLRHLILELAIRGKLVAQNPSDESARVLLKRIADEKDQLELKGKIKKQKTLPSIAKNDIPFNLPQSWEWVRLGTISEANTGYAFKSEEYTESGTFVLRVTNINPDGSINLLDTKFISNEAAKATYEKFLLSQDDLLLVMVGGSLGKLGVVSNECLPAVLNQNMWRLSRFGKMPLKYFVTGVTFINNNQLKITSSTHGHLAQGEYMNKLFPLPPLAEQHRIVAKVDELMALCDELEKQETKHLKSHQLLVETLLGTLTQANDASEFQTAWDRLAKHFDDIFTTEDSIDQLKQTILQLAVMGKLVPQDPNDEPASELLKRIQIEKEKLVKSEKIKKQKALPKIQASEKHFDLPDGWEWERWGNLANWITYGFTRPMSHVSEGVPIITGKNVVNRSIDVSTADFTTLKEFNELNDKDRPKRGDILVTKDGSIGRAAVVVTDDPICINQSVAILWLKDKPLNKEFLLNVILSPQTQSEFLSKAAGVAIKHISVTDFAMMLCQVPPLPEQIRIVNKINELFNLCDQLKERVVESQKVVNQMADSMLEQVV